MIYNKHKIFIAEIKPKSPFGFISALHINQIIDMAIKYGDWVSVHTNELWGGSFKHLKEMRKITKKPILAKGLHQNDIDIEKSIDAGADYVLCCDRIPWNLIDKNPSVLKKIIVEPSLFSQMSFVPNNIKVCWNARNLKTGDKKPMFESLAGLVKIHYPCHWVCQASFIKSIHDVDNNVDAFIVGQNLQDFCLMFQ